MSLPQVGSPLGRGGGGNAGVRPARATRGAPKPRRAAAPAAAAGAGRSVSRAATAPTAAAGVKRAVGGKKNGAAKPPKKAKPGAPMPAAASKSRGQPWSGHPGWHCRRGRGLIDYIYTAPTGEEFTDEASALKAYEGTGVDDSEAEEEEEEAPARRRHNAPAARQPAPAQAPAPTPASAPTAAAPGAKKSRWGEGAAAKPAKKPKPAAPKPAAASKPRGQPWSGHPGWHCRPGRGLVDYVYTAPDGEEFTDEPSALAYAEDDNSDDIGLDSAEEDGTRQDDPGQPPGHQSGARGQAARSLGVWLWAKPINGPVGGGGFRQQMHHVS